MLTREQHIQRIEYSATSPQDQFIVQLLRKHIEQILSTYAKPTSPLSRALDVGCGRQPFRKDLEALGYTYMSLDAKQNLEETVDIVYEIDQPLTPEVIKQGTFDFILCTEVMEHVANWDVAFSNFAQLLAPGARLVITCPHFYQLHEEPYDFWRPTLHSLRYFAERVGLRSLHLVAAGDAWDVLGTLLANCQPSAGSSRLLHRGVAKV